jgi:chromosome partitioning protein
MGLAVCIASQKGGVGKTTTAIHLAGALALAERQTLLVDSDPQGHATIGMGIDRAGVSGSLYHAMTGQSPVKELILNSQLAFLKILPACMRLYDMEMAWVKNQDKEYSLRHLIGDLKKTYDYIIIDTPPSVNLMTIQAIIAADLLVIPFLCEFYAIEGLYSFLMILKFLKGKYNPGIKIAGILFTLFEESQPLARKIADKMRYCFNGNVFQTVIPRTVHFQNAAAMGKPLFLKDIMSVGSLRYLEMAKEFIQNWPLNVPSCIETLTA